MKIIGSTLLIACLSVSAFGASGHEHCNISTWEIALSVGDTTLTEKEEGHKTEGTTLHLHATKGTEYSLLGFPLGYSIGAETFLDSEIDHHCLHVGATLFLTDSIKLSFGPSLEYAKHAHHEEGEEEDEHHDDEEEADWESEIGWFIEACACLYHIEDISIGLAVCYGETDHEEHQTIGIHIGKVFH